VSSYYIFEGVALEMAIAYLVELIENLTFFLNLAFSFFNLTTPKELSHDWLYLHIMSLGHQLLKGLGFAHLKNIEQV